MNLFVLVSTAGTDPQVIFFCLRARLGWRELISIEFVASAAELQAKVLVSNQPEFHRQQSEIWISGRSIYQLRQRIQCRDYRAFLPAPKISQVITCKKKRSIRL